MDSLRLIVGNTALGLSVIITGFLVLCASRHVFGKLTGRHDPDWKIIIPPWLKLGLLVFITSLFVLVIVALPGWRA